MGRCCPLASMERIAFELVGLRINLEPSLIRASAKTKCARQMRLSEVRFLACPCALSLVSALCTSFCAQFLFLSFFLLLLRCATCARCLRQLPLFDLALFYRSLCSLTVCRKVLNFLVYLALLAPPSKQHICSYVPVVRLCVYFANFTQLMK